MRSGWRTAAELMLTFSAPPAAPPHVLQRPNPTADRKRDEDSLGYPADDVNHDAAPLVRGGDVVEDDLVGPSS